jgi:acetyl-CoA synthetase
MRDQKESFRSSNRSDNIESHLIENRVFNPTKTFSKKAYISSFELYRDLYRESIKNPEEFWSQQASELLLWRRKWKSVLEWKEPFAQWFVGGKLNVSENCLDRHLSGPRRNQAALIWEGEPGEKRTLTYHQLHREVCKFANVLKRNHVKLGDRVIIYMPMCPEAAIAMLACARLGIIHSVVFGGFGSAAIKDRVNDCQAKMIITADGGYRRGAIVPLKRNVDEALKENEHVEKVIVFRRANNQITITEGRDVWWHREMDYVDANCKPVTLKQHKKPTPELRETLREHVAEVISAIAKPDDVRFADGLPKTRSGKIMRRLLKEVASSGRVTGDTTTLEDYSVLAKLSGREE